MAGTRSWSSPTPSVSASAPASMTPWRDSLTMATSSRPGRRMLRSCDSRGHVQQRERRAGAPGRVRPTRPGGPGFRPRRSRGLPLQVTQEFRTSAHPKPGVLRQAGLLTKDHFRNPHPAKDKIRPISGFPLPGCCALPRFLLPRRACPQFLLRGAVPMTSFSFAVPHRPNFSSAAAHTLGFSLSVASRPPLTLGSRALTRPRWAARVRSRGAAAPRRLNLAARAACPQHILRDGRAGQHPAGRSAGEVARVC